MTAKRGASPAKPGKAGTPATPAKPAKPARPAKTGRPAWPTRPAPSPPPSNALAIGRLEAGRVVVDDPQHAARLESRTSAGAPGLSGAYELTLAEAAWLAADGRLLVRDGRANATVAAILAAGGASGRAEVEHLAYRDLRERGFVARPVAGTAGRFAVWPRGTGSGEPAFHLRACSDADGLPAADLAEAARAKTILCVVDGDGAVTHYQVSVATPAGDVPEGDLPRATGAVLSDRVLVEDAAAAKAYGQREFLGTPHPAGLLLSFPEAEGLRRRGVLSVPGGLAERTPEAARLLAVHLALRAAGAVPKSGFRFGTDLRAYRGAPDDGHAEWLIHCAAAGEVLPWSLLSRGVRLAHGVRKNFLVAVPDGKGLLFAQLAWYRP